MKIQEVRNMTDEERRAELERLRRHVFDLRTAAVTEKLEDSSLVTKARRDIARIITAMNERRSTGVKPAKA
jgi:ribosomal protein L29